MQKETFHYIGVSYKQGQSARELITFCAPAEQIRKWGGIPSKTTVFDGGFQRALSKRYKRIVKFFEAGDVSPTSIIVAFRLGELKLTPVGYPPGWPSRESLTYPPALAHISFSAVDIDPMEADTYDLAEQVTAAIGPRLGDTWADPIEDTDGLPAEPEGPQPMETTAEEEDDTDDSIDVGVSKLRDFYSFISSRERIEAWIHSETERYHELKKSGRIGQDEPSPEVNLRILLLSLLKPAMIVDGQHRVWGAAHAAVRDDIVFTVCALKDTDWVEQVFQFVVLNKLAKAISKDFLTGLLNTSLTNTEITSIEPKLQRVGITNSDRIIMRVVNFDRASPFFDMVAQPGEVLGATKEGKLSGQGMLKIARRWRNLGTGSNRKTQRELRLFEKCLVGDSKTTRAGDWVSRQWSKFFHSFWDVLRSIYEPEQVWVKSSGFNLLMIVTMYELQDFFIETKAQADIRFTSLEDFRGQVKVFFEDVPAAFFQNWTATGLQSGKGPQQIREALQMFKNGESLKKVKDSSPLFNPMAS
jgi:hypothetical protein